MGSYRDFDKSLSSFVPAVEKLDLNPELITVYYGADVTEDDAESTSESFASYFPKAEVSVVNGGQPIYYYMISIE